LNLPKTLEKKIKKIKLPQAFGCPSPSLLSCLVVSKRKKVVLVVPKSDLRVFQKILKSAKRPLSQKCLPSKNEGLTLLTYEEIKKFKTKSSNEITWKNGKKLHDKYSLKDCLKSIGYAKKPYKPEAEGEWHIVGDRLHIWIPNQKEPINFDLFGENLDDPRYKKIIIPSLVDGDKIKKSDYAKLGEWWLYRNGEIEEEITLPKNIKRIEISSIPKPNDIFRVTYSDNVFSGEREEKDWENFLKIKKIKLIRSGKEREWEIDLHSHEYWEKLDIWISPKPNGVKDKKRIFSLDNLEVGEHLIHKDHGVCKFGGLKITSVSGKKKEFMRLFFDGNDEILVPVILLNRVQRYIGPKIKKLDKLGGKRWQKKVTKTKKETLDFAKDLFKLYNSRKNTKREKTWEKDSELEYMFSNSFPYKLTSEQLLALNEILQDMSSKKIMNRILAGDVGYGKTEVALRAAFRVLINNSQVALLAPTTVLVQQHYTRIKKRLQHFGIECFNLSRLTSAKKKKEAHEKISSGKCCFVVGTHALLNDEIDFKKLGLLIIDEEQRFGVKHKEKLTIKNKYVDVLTLSATPIPRTLFTSLVGLKDATTITTPPRGRKPIKTVVKRWNENYVIESIEKEIGRSGKVFFLHNHIHTIKQREKWLKERFSNVITVHGRLSSKTLENRILEFLKTPKSILLTTTIIQNGVDFENANTIIVEDTTRLGLSQLHQLRGRIGRRDKKGIAYFFTPEKKEISIQVRQRLRKLSQYSDLGAGFSIAKADLELRGAGEILGTSQSGHIWQLGLEFFSEILFDSVNYLKKSKIKKHPEISIPFFGMLPKHYPEKEKLSMYSYIFEDASEKDIRDLKTEWYKENQINNSVEDLLLSSMVYKIAKSLPIQKASYRNDHLEIVLNEKSTKKKLHNWTSEKNILRIKTEPEPRKMLEELERLEKIIS